MEEDKNILDITKLMLDDIDAKDLPPELTHLYCSNNLIREINVEKLENLMILEINNNKLTILPKLPLRLERLNCSDNNLNNIDSLEDHPNLKYLICVNNNIKRIPFIPNLEHLNIKKNKVTS